MTVRRDTVGEVIILIAWDYGRLIVPVVLFDVLLFLLVVERDAVQMAANGRRGRIEHDTERVIDWRRSTVAIGG